MAQEALFEPWNDPNEPPLIQFKNVTKKFGDFTAIDDLTQDIYAKEFFALLGPSGCGKSTTLRMISGHDHQNDGTIQIDGADMGALAPAKRPTAMMFQSYALFPHMTVEDNVAFALRIQGAAKDQRRDRAAHLLAAHKEGVMIDTNASTTLWQKIRDVDLLVDTDGDIWKLSCAPASAPAIIATLLDRFDMQFFAD